MKKIILALFALVVSINAMAYDDELFVKSGDINIMKQENSASFTIDFSQMKVGDLSLDEYAKTRKDADFMVNFKRDIKTGEAKFVSTYNKKSKAFKFHSDSKYAATFVLETMDMGNVGAAIFGWSASAGGIAVTGNINVTDVSTGATVLVIRVDSEKGKGMYAESARMESVFESLAKAVLKMTK